MILIGVTSIILTNTPRYPYHKPDSSIFMLSLKVAAQSSRELNNKPALHLRWGCFSLRPSMDQTTQKPVVPVHGMWLKYNTNISYNMSEQFLPKVFRDF